MTIQLDNEHFQELKELPGFKERYSVLNFILDNSEPLIEEAGAKERYEIRYDVADNTIEENFEGETAFEKYVGSTVIGIPTYWQECDFFYGVIHCADKNDNFLIAYEGEDTPYRMDENLDENTKKVLSDAINPRTVIKFVEDVIEAIRYKK